MYNEGRLGWGEGSFCEQGTRGRQADPRHQPKIRWGAPTPKGGGTGVTGAADRSAQRAGLMTSQMTSKWPSMALWPTYVTMAADGR